MPDSSLVASDRPAVARHGAIRAIPTELPSEPPLVESAEFRTTLYLLARRWSVVAATTLLGVGASVWLARRSLPMYHAAATVRLTNPGAVLADPTDASAVDRLGNSDPLQSRLQLLRSRGIAERAVRLDSGLLRVRAAGIDDTVLRELSVSPDAPARTIALVFGADSVRATWRGDSTAAAPYGRPLATPAATFSIAARPTTSAGTLRILAPDAAAAFVQHGLRARSRDNTDVVDVTFDAESPVLAQRAVNLAVRAYGDMLLEQAQGQNRRRLAFIGAELKRNDALLGAAQSELAAFRGQHGAYGAREEVGAVQTWLQTTNQQRERLTAAGRRIQYFLDQYDHAPDGARDATLQALLATSDDGPSGDPVTWDLYRELVRLQASRDTLTAGPYPRAATHPEVVRIDALLATTRARLESTVRGRLSGIRTQLQSLDDLAARNTERLRAFPQAEKRETQLTNAVARLSIVSDELRAAQQRALIAEAGSGSGVEVVDLASLPTDAVNKAGIRGIGTGAVLGIFVGVLLVVGLERLNWTIRGREDIENTLRIPELALIPQAALGHPTHERLRLTAWRRRTAAAGDDANVPVIDPFAAESYRVLRTNLLYAGTHAPHRTIAVASPLPGDGKTTVVANLAVSFAHYGMRVLVIDADVRRPSIHRALGVARAPGLMQYLAGHASFAEAIHPTTLPNLHVLPAGSLQDGSHEPFGDPRVGELLARASRDYDVVLLDNAPVLLSSDAAIVAAHCDSAVLVVRAGHTDRDAARHALRQLHAVRASVVGAVLNDPDNRAIRAGGYHAAYDYGYGTGYGVRPLETEPAAPAPAPARAPAPTPTPVPAEPLATRLTGHGRAAPPRATSLVPRGSGVGIADAILAVRARAAANAANATSREVE